MLVLDLDGTLTNSKKEITAPTKKALIEIQEAGKKVVLASGRPINGVFPLAKDLQLDRFGSYILSSNGARITRCADGYTVYNRTLPESVIAPIWMVASSFPGLDIMVYDDHNIYSGLDLNEYTELESFVCYMPIVQVEDFVGNIQFPINKLLIAGDPAVVEQAMIVLKKQFHSLLNIYRSEPFYLEIMPRKIDKAYSLQKLLSSLGLNAEDMICCGDGYNDISMLEYAGLGIAMANAQPVVKESADFITLSNDEDGILHVVNQFMR